MNMQHQQGLTLIELLTAIAVLTVLLTVGVPGLNGYLEKSRLRSAAETLAASLYYARSETIVVPAEDQKVHVSFYRQTDAPDNWCFGLSRASSCNCRLNDTTNDNACFLESAGNRVLKVTRAREYPGIQLDEVAFGGSNHTSFDPVRGTASAGHVSFKQHQALHVVLSPLGRVRICSPTSAYLHGYPAC